MKKRKLIKLLVGLIFINYAFLANAFADDERCAKTGADFKMSFTEAYAIAEATKSCTRVGPLKDKHWCNEGTGTWWIMLKSKLKNCSPACVIDVEKKTSDVNFMCTGLLLMNNEKR